MTEPGRGPAAGPDGRLRCPWALSAPEYVAYHDEEWGCPVRDDRGIFERLCLEAFQSGLSWLTILRKRENFRAAFDNFDIPTVARYGPGQVARLLTNPGIIRNRAKIESTIRNAQCAATLPEGLSAFIWSHAPAPAESPPAGGPKTMADIPASTPASKALSRELKLHGFTFTGPVTTYATMQACGLVNDHLSACFRRGACA